MSKKSSSTLNKWESGERLPSLANLKALAQLYETPLHLFIEPPLTAFEQIDAMAAGERISVAIDQDAAEVAEMRRRVDELTQSQQQLDALHPPEGQRDRDTPEDTVR